MTLTDPGLTDEITALYLNRMVGKWILQGTSLAYYLNLVLNLIRLLYNLNNNAEI